MTLKELLEKRAKAVADARSIQDKADKEKRDLTADEAKQVDAHLKESHDFKRQADEIERTEKRRAELEAQERELSQSRGRQTEPDEPGEGRGRDGGAERGRDAGRERGGRDGGGGGADAREARWRTRGGAERHIRFNRTHDNERYNRAFELYLRTGRANADMIAQGIAPRREDESRDLAADSGVDGGYLLAPTQMVAGIIQNADDQVFVRQYASVYQVTAAQNLGAVSLDADPEEGDWTAEISDYDDDQAMKFGKRELNPTPLTKSVRISRKLLRMMPSVQGLVQSRLAYRFGITQEKQFLIGDGANKPLGLFTASNDGIPTSRDISTGNTATEIKADNLISVKYGLKPQYRGRARWLFHRDAVLRIALLKDGNGQYLWRQGLVAGDQDTLLGLPLHESEYVPNTFTTGKYVGLLGDLSFYWIAEALQMELQVLDQTRARQNQVEYLARMELDAMPVLGEAFVRVKLG